jgi:hypothetical protein
MRFSNLRGAGTGGREDRPAPCQVWRRRQRTSSLAQSLINSGKRHLEISILHPKKAGALVDSTVSAPMAETQPKRICSLPKCADRSLHGSSNPYNRGLAARVTSQLLVLRLGPPCELPTLRLLSHLSLHVYHRGADLRWIGRHIKRGNVHAPGAAVLQLKFVGVPIRAIGRRNRRGCVVRPGDDQSLLSCRPEVAAARGADRCGTLGQGNQVVVSTIHIISTNFG